MSIINPSVSIINFKPPNIKLVNKNIYYLINRSGKHVYDTDNNHYGISTGYSLRPTYKSLGAIEIKDSKEQKYWISGDVKYIIENNYILTNIFKLKKINF